MNYYSFHISDWVLHTNHLTLEEEAVYRRLIDYYYDTEQPIPEKTQSVIRRLRLGSYSDVVGLILSEFFTLMDDGWHNLRADIEITEYNKKAELARKNGRKGGRPKKQKQLNQQLNNNENPEKTQSVNSGNQEKSESKANQEPITNNQEPIGKNKEKKTTTAKPKFLIAPDFEPSERCFELIQESGVDVSFATSLIKEFIFYWEQQGEKRPGWDTTFLNHAKRQWWFKQNEKSQQHNQSTKNQKLEESNQELFRRAQQLEQEAEIEENRGGISEALGVASNALSAAEL